MMNKTRKIKSVLLVGVISFILLTVGSGGIMDFGLLSVQKNVSNISKYPANAGNHDPILIDGDGDLATFIGNENMSGDGLSYETSYIIENFTIDGTPGSGIEIQNTNAFLSIRNCTVLNTGTFDEEFGGIHIKSSSNIEITNCTLDNNERAITLSGNAFNNICINNTVRYTSGSGAISTAGAHHNQILNNTVMYSEEAAIELWESENSVVAGNILIDNQAGITIGYSINNLLENNIIADVGASGIYLDYSPNNEILSNTVSNCGDDSIQLVYSDDVLISENSVSFSGYGICLRYSNYVEIRLNTIFDHYNGISLISSNENTISVNEISSNTQSGIYLMNSNNNHIFENNIIASTYGDCIRDLGEDNDIHDNECSGLFDGGAPQFTDIPQDVSANEGYTDLSIMWIATDLYP
ncbi:MAG: right-handed parallel beta-helix repeat-containing protein, partial [Thermodesulfovibrionia bacterium]|nr:right-handed parallel beta-helix repeat-containing protein [Thermodesulfovibrionia bacterium]